MRELGQQRWQLSHRQDQVACRIADRHYSRRKPGSKQVGQPSRCLVLLTTTKDALWITSWPYADLVKHSWAGAWENSCFRNEGAGLSSELIREAVAITRWYWPEVPAKGMITFVNARKVRHKRDPGRCFLRAGFRLVGETKKGLLALQLLPEDMPNAVMPADKQL